MALATVAEVDKRSIVQKLEGDQWRHKKIVLSPDNKGFRDIVLINVSGDDFHVVAEFVQVIMEDKVVSRKKPNKV